MVVPARTIGKLQRDLPGSEHSQVRPEGSEDMRVSEALVVLLCARQCGYLRKLQIWENILEIIERDV